MPRVAARRGRSASQTTLLPAALLPEEARWDDLLVRVVESPASRHIIEYLTHARELGMDLNDGDTVDRAVAAGTKAYEAEVIRNADARDWGNLKRPRGLLLSPVVYYMRMSNLVKIGTSTNIGRRLSDVNPQGVMAMEPGGFQLEEERHDQFADLRQHGEWFLLDERLGAHIADIREAFEVSTGVTVESWLHDSTPRRNRSPRSDRAPHSRHSLSEPPVAASLGPQQDQTGLVTAAEASRLIGITRQGFNARRRAGIVSPVTSNAAGQKLYRVSDVLAFRSERSQAG